MVAAMAREVQRCELTARFADEAAPSEKEALSSRKTSLLCVVAVISYNQQLMKSKLRLESRKALLEANQRLRSEQRVRASVAQSRVIAQLQEAGRKLRGRAR